MSGTKTPDSTGRPSEGRKLTAVLHADMVGYSRLIGLDDVGTLERLRTLRRTLIDPAIAEHGGRIVNTGGDSLLIVFDSVDGAVRCAVKVQQQMPGHNRDHPPDQAIMFRVGINVGDVIPDGTDVHGDVVNVAARLQAECSPGGVSVSRAVREHLRDRLDLIVEELGALELKNIARPVEAFVLKLDGAAIPKSTKGSLSHDTPHTMPLSDKPSIAVLAFSNMSGDVDQEYFADGVANDIITELSRIRSFFVIARTSSFAYKKQAVDLKLVARELGVRSLVEGSVRRSGDRVRITAQLIDAETGNHIWAERYDREIKDIFAIQDEITLAVTKAIRPAVADAEQWRALRKPPEKLSAWEAYQRGLWHLLNFQQEDVPYARQFLRQAIAIDPTLASAYTAMAWLYTSESGTFGLRPFEETAPLAAEQARKAVAIDPNDADAHGLLAFVLPNCGEIKSALEHVERALSISPSCAIAHEARGTILIFNKEPRKARKSLALALELDPRAFQYSRMQIGISFYFERNYEEAVDVLRAMVVDNPSNPATYRWLAAALGQLGRKDEAREALKSAIERGPESFNRYTQQRPPWFQSDDFEHMLEGLRKAGWRG
jgi:adenylate cyclase